MIDLLKKAFDEAQKLPVEEQQALAAIILEEIADEARWDKKFAETRDVLQAISAEADAAIEAGEVEPLEFPRRR